MGLQHRYISQHVIVVTHETSSVDYIAPWICLARQTAQHEIVVTHGSSSMNCLTQQIRLARSTTLLVQDERHSHSSIDCLAPLSHPDGQDAQLVVLAAHSPSFMELGSSWMQAQHISLVHAWQPIQWMDPWCQSRVSQLFFARQYI